MCIWHIILFLHGWTIYASVFNCSISRHHRHQLSYETSFSGMPVDGFVHENTFWLEWYWIIEHTLCALAPSSPSVNAKVVLTLIIQAYHLIPSPASLHCHYTPRKHLVKHLLLSDSHAPGWHIFQQLVKAHSCSCDKHWGATIWHHFLHDLLLQ